MNANLCQISSEYYTYIYVAVAKGRLSKGRLCNTAITRENIENSFTFNIENELALPEMMYMIELEREVKYDFC